MAISENTNNLFSSRLVKIDKQNLEVVGLPKSKVKDKETFVVKFCKRKSCEQVLRVKNDLKKLNTAKVELPTEYRIFNNQRL